MVMKTMIPCMPLCLVQRHAWETLVISQRRRFFWISSLFCLMMWAPTCGLFWRLWHLRNGVIFEKGRGLIHSLVIFLERYLTSHACCQRISTMKIMEKGKAVWPDYCFDPSKMIKHEAWVPSSRDFIKIRTLISVTGVARTHGNSKLLLWQV